MLPASYNTSGQPCRRCYAGFVGSRDKPKWKLLQCIVNPSPWRASMVEIGNYLCVFGRRASSSTHADLCSRLPVYLARCSSGVSLGRPLARVTRQCSCCSCCAPARRIRGSPNNTWCRRCFASADSIKVSSPTFRALRSCYGLKPARFWRDATQVVPECRLSS